MTSIITVENLSKKFIISHKKTERYTSLRDTLTNSMRRASGKLFHPRSLEVDPEHEEFWALKDVNFEIAQGDRVGIIGRNGAGKSTLLKILARVTEPSGGCIKINGRVASLLEVGTGFHPELTGRENIFLNGAILGMKKIEIKRKFDEIVTFAEIEKFLDTPVKRYSSGMYVRLAFAVAAHLEPEVLIIDEVLAVGDAQFQKKCLGKIQEADKYGRTVLFVSHNMGAVEQSCSSVILMKNGTLARKSTDVLSVIKEYASANDTINLPYCWENPNTAEFNNDYFKTIRFCFIDSNGNEIKEMPIRNDKDIWVKITGEVKKLDPALYFGIGVLTDTDTFLFGSMFFDGHPERWPKINVGLNTLKCRIPNHIFNEGIYKIEIHGGLLHKEFYHYPGKDNPKIYLEINGGLSESPLWTEKRMGFFAPILEWTK